MKETELKDQATGLNMLDMADTYKVLDVTDRYCKTNKIAGKWKLNDDELMFFAYHFAFYSVIQSENIDDFVPERFFTNPIETLFLLWADRNRDTKFKDIFSENIKQGIEKLREEMKLLKEDYRLDGIRDLAYFLSTNFLDHPGDKRKIQEDIINANSNIII
jgi:hypothetical protein